MEAAQPVQNEATFAAMREFDRMFLSLWRIQENALRPPSNTIAIGNADFEYLLKVSVGESFLRALRKGSTPEEALEQAKIDGNECVKIWNERTSHGRASFGGRRTLQTWDKGGESAAEYVYLVFIAILRRRTGVAK